MARKRLQSDQPFLPLGRRNKGHAAVAALGPILFSWAAVVPRMASFAQSPPQTNRLPPSSFDGSGTLQFRGDELDVNFSDIRPDTIRPSGLV